MLATLYLVVAVFFTTGGVAQQTTPVPDALTCEAMAQAISPAFDGKKVTISNTEVTILDAQGKCVAFTQGLQASN